METRTVKIRAFTYLTKVDTVRGDRVVRRDAFRGDEIEIDEVEAERGDRLGAFLTEDEKLDPSGRVITVDEEGEDTAFDASEAGEDELLSWIEDQNPTVKETVEAADGDPDVARRILEAEEETGDSRAGVVKGLGAIIDRG